MSGSLSSYGTKHPSVWAGLTFAALIGTFVVVTVPQAPRKKNVPLATCYALESAVNNFYTEYGAMPKVPAEVKTDTPDGVKLLTILLGKEISATPQNLRAIKFLSVKEAKDGRYGLIYNPSGTFVVGLFDPWGNPYTLMLDLDYDEQIEVVRGSIAKTLNGRRVAAYSPGQDGKLGTVDDVVTW